MKKIEKLNQALEKLESQKQSFNSIDNTSLFQFIKYKKILSKQRKISNKMEKAISLGNAINFWYDIQNNSWIQNPNISCRKYFKLDKNAMYNKDLKLYKLGLTDKKPLPPLIQSIKEITSPIVEQLSEKFKIISSKITIFKKIRNSYTHFTSKILPNKINNIAINTAKLGIKGYRTLQSDCRYIRNSLNSKKSIMYIRKIINEANEQISQSERQNSFKESLKVDSYSFNPINITHSTNSQINIKKTHQTSSLKEYEISL